MAPLWEGRQPTVLQCWRDGRCKALQCSTAHPVSEDSTTSIDTIDFTTSTVSLLSATSVFPSLPRFPSIIRIHTLIPPAMGIHTALTAHTDMAPVMAVTGWDRSLCKYNADSRAPDIIPALVDGIMEERIATMGLA
jgi:hypothetical protein